MPDHPAALLPPEKWRHLRWHWIRFPPFDPVPAYWRHESATWLTLERGGDGNYLASLGFVYVKPCVPAAFVPDPENREQIDAVARALFEMDKGNWVAPDYSQHEDYMRAWARRILRALRALQ